MLTTQNLLQALAATAGQILAVLAVLRLCYVFVRYTAKQPRR